MAARRRTMRLNRVDFPTLGRPTRATRGRGGLTSDPELPERRRALAPALLHLHGEPEEHLAPEEPLEPLPRPGADVLQHRAPLPDDDGLLRVALHPDDRAHPHEPPPSRRPDSSN